ncbi:MAG: HK97 gp10 family phage protein [Devosia sp.]
MAKTSGWNFWPPRGRFSVATKVLGIDRLNRKLRAFPAAVEQEIRAAMEASANEIIALAKSLTTSNRVRASIGWTWGEAPDGALVLGSVGGKGRGAGNLRITIYAGDASTMVGTKYKVQLARLLEFGTAPHLNKGRFAGSQHPGTPAAPFFYVSWRAGRKRAKGRVTRAVNKAARRIAAGG